MPKTALIIALAAAAGTTPPAWIQLLPAGTAQPADAREAWSVDAEAVVAASASKVPFAIDADHATDLLPKGSANPAYGWVEELAAKGPAGEPGVWGRVEWTDLGLKAVAGRAYRFISPVFFHDKASRVVTQVFRASLVNDPALSLKALAAREGEPTKTETSMTFAAKVAALVALAATATEDQILAALTAQGETLKATAARLTSIGAAAGISGEINDDHVVALAAKLKAPAASGDLVPKSEVDKLQLQIASLQKEVTGDKATAAVNAAIASGKLIPAQRAWALDYASREPEKFATFVAAQPAILADGTIKPVTAAEGELTADQKAICVSMGLSEDAYKKELASISGAKKEVA